MSLTEANGVGLTILLVQHPHAEQHIWLTFDEIKDRVHAENALPQSLSHDAQLNIMAKGLAFTAACNWRSSTCV